MKLLWILVLILFSCKAERASTLQKLHLYSAGEKGAVDFKLAPGAEELLIQAYPLSSPSGAGLEQVMQARNLPFSFRYQIFAASGRLLLDRVFNDQSPCLDDGEMQVHPQSEKAQLQACRSRALALPLAAFKSESSLSLRLSSDALPLQAPLRELAFSVHVREPDSDYRAGFLWQRLSPQEKAAITKPLYLAENEMQKSEQAALVRNLYKPLAPLGRSPQEFTDLVLYEKAQPQPPFNFAAYELIGPGAQVVLPILMENAEVFLQVSPLVRGASNQAGSFRVCWQTADLSRTGSCVSDQSYSVQDFQREQKLAFRAGRLVLSAAQPLIVRARYRLPEREGRAISDVFTLKSSVQNFHAFSIPEQTPVEVALPFLGDSMPIKLSVWRPLQASDRSAPLTLHFKLFDAQRRLIRQQKLTVQVLASSFDRPAGQTTFSFLSLPQAVYLQATAQGQTLQIEADQAIFLHMAMHRESTPSFFRVVTAGTVVPDLQKPTWVSLEAKAKGQLQRELIYSYPEQEESLQVGQTQRYSSFGAANSNLGTFALVPMDASEDAPKQPWASVQEPYYELDRQLTTATLLPTALDQGLSLAVFNERPLPTELRLSINGETLVSRPLAHGMSEFKLPLPASLLKSGRLARIHIESPARASLKVFLAQVIPTDSPRKPYLKRYLYRTKAGPVQFALAKSTPFQLLSLTLIRRVQVVTPLQLDVALAFQRVLDRNAFCCETNWTLSRRQFQISPESKVPWAYLYSGERGLVYKLPLLLKDDVSKGPFTATIDLHKQEEAFVALTGTIPADGILATTLQNAAQRTAEF